MHVVVSRRISEAVDRAKNLLRDHGYRCETSPADLVRWFEAKVTHRDLSLEEVARRPWLVVHELLEIDIVKRTGLALTKDVILRNPATVYEAHLKAAQREIELAAMAGDLEHLRSRRADIRTWRDDPMHPVALRDECEALEAVVARTHARRERSS